MYLLVSEKRDQLFAWIGRNFRFVCHLDESLFQLFVTDLILRSCDLDSTAHARAHSPPAGEPKDQFALDAMKTFRKLHQQLLVAAPKLTTVHDGGANLAFWDEFDNVT